MRRQMEQVLQQPTRLWRQQSWNSKCRKYNQDMFLAISADQIKQHITRTTTGYSSVRSTIGRSLSQVNPTNIYAVWQNTVFDKKNPPRTC